ncbi:MAG: peptidylprolyl isomerase [Gemmatimonadaceae bacterium]
MTRIRFLGALTFASLAACSGLKEAFTAHVDVAASAGSQELSVQQLADMLGKSRVPISKEVAQSVADAWVNYQLLGQAAAAGDSLDDNKLIDEVMWPVYTSSKTNKFYKQLTERWVADTSTAAAQAAYNSGDLLAARHILFTVTQGEQASDEAVMKKAQGVLARTNSANFAAMAKQHGSDGTKDVGGDLGVFPPESMVPEFAKAVQALKPGEIGPLVKTQFGYHIVRRSTFDEVKDQFQQQFSQRQRFVAESTYITGLESAAKITIKDNAAKVVKEVGVDPAAHAKDKTVIATSRLGDFTAASVSRWLSGFPNPDQIRTQIAQAPDSLMKTFVTNLLRNELILDEAEKANVTVDSAEVKEIRQSFRAIVQNTWAGLGITPAALADSAKSKADKERFAASRVNAYLGRLVNGEEQYIEVPAPLVQALHKKYDWKLNSAALDKVVADAQPIRAKADSLRAAQTPSSAVPMPGGAPQPTIPPDTTRN